MVTFKVLVWIFSAISWTCLVFQCAYFVAFQGLDVDALPLEKIGPLFEYHPVFPARVNTGTDASIILFLVFRFF